jgi:hypothetical protein
MLTKSLFRLLPLAAALALTAACDAQQAFPVDGAQPAQAAAQADAQTRPPFSNETVRKLNPIVERAKVALDRFDEMQAELAAAREAGDTAKLAALEAELRKLKAETDAAHIAFQAEKKALLAREEYYDAVILGAMEQFVAEAPDEIAEALGATKK